MNTPINQGDVPAIPFGWVNPEKGKNPFAREYEPPVGSLKRKPHAVVAWGEVTGHKHQFTNGEVELHEDDRGVLYVKVLSEKAVLTHEEHGQVVYEPDRTVNPEGWYMLPGQQQYNWLEDAVERVLD